MRDRATFAMNFASAFAIDAFLDLSRTLPIAPLEETQNPRQHSAEGTIRLDDIYHLHQLAYCTHSTAAQAVGALGEKNRQGIQQLLGSCAVIAIATLVFVHIAFVSPFTQISAASALSQAIYEAGSFGSSGEASESCDSAQQQERVLTIVRLEISNASVPQQWVQPYVLQLQQASSEAQARGHNERTDQRREQGGMPNTTAIQNLANIVMPRLSDFATWIYNLAFSIPCYEIAYGGDSAAWLAVQSGKAREALGVRTVSLQVSAGEAKLFGPQWARCLLSTLRLYDIYVLHALPLQFLKVHGSVATASQLHVTIAGSSNTSVGQAREVDILPVAELASMATAPGPLRIIWAIRRTLSAALWLLGALPCAVILSAFLRRLAILSVRTQVYSSYTVRQMRRYAFIAEPLRRINCYSSNELLELWSGWAICAVIGVLVLTESIRSGIEWTAALFCYALAEYWGIVHVRTVQSRWIFPRATALLHGGALVYATWWPLCPAWLLAWTLVSSQFWLIFYLLHTFDCHAGLPEQPPHRLLFRSSLLPGGIIQRGGPADAFRAAPRSASVRHMQSRGTQTDDNIDGSKSAAPGGGTQTACDCRPPKQDAAASISGSRKAGSKR